LATLAVAAPRLAILGTDHQTAWIPDSPPAVPPDAAALRADPAVQLFVQTAQAVQPAFPLDPATLRLVAAITARLDGLPLALELAATRSRHFAPADLLGRLEARLTVLTGGSRDMPARHQTLRALLAWSVDLLTPREQQIFAACAVFAGGWTESAATAVLPAAAGADPLPALRNLVQHSLVQTVFTQNQTRFRMLETVREYAQDQLEARGGAAAVQAAHAAYYATHAATLAAQLHGPTQVAAVHALTAEQDNYRQVLAWGQRSAPATIAAPLAYTLWPFWDLQGFWSEGQYWIGQIPLDADSLSPTVRAGLAEAQGVLTYNRGQLDDAETWLRRSLNLYQMAGDQPGEATVRNHLSMIARRRGNREEARAFLADSSRLFTAGGDAFGLAQTRYLQGTIAFTEDADDEARQYFEESLARFRVLQDWEGIARLLIQVSMVIQKQEGPEGALPLLAESLALYRQIGRKSGIAKVLTGMAEALRLLEAGDKARTLYEEALAIQQELGTASGIALGLLNCGVCAADRGAFPEAVALYQESLRLYQELGHTLFEIYTLTSLGEAFRQMGDGPHAHQFYEQGLTRARQKNSASEIVRALFGLGQLNRQEGDLPAAGACYQTSLDLYQQLQDSAGIARVLVALGILWGLEQTWQPLQQWGPAIYAYSMQLGARREPLDRQEAHLLEQVIQRGMERGTISTTLATSLPNAAQLVDEVQAYERLVTRGGFSNPPR
jgi:tetratricopeptide (TPR) repeat protein